jgi:hypothetical protein
MVNRLNLTYPRPNRGKIRGLEGKNRVQVKLITRLDRTTVEKRKAQKERLLREIKQLENEMKILDPDDAFDGPLWTDKKKLKNEAELQLSIVEPELAIAGADKKSEQIRIKQLEQEYDLAWNKYNLYWALREHPVNETVVSKIRDHIKELENQKERSEQV